MLGAIAGDICGSEYERLGPKTTDIPIFTDKSHITDDTVLSLAIADRILNGGSYAHNVKKYGRAYPNAGYGFRFRGWLSSNDYEAYNSWGNGSAMRVSAVGFAFNDLARVLEEAKLSAEITHNHPEGIKGAQATAAAIFLGRTGSSKAAIQHYISSEFGYDLNRSLTEIRPSYRFDVSCAGSVPESIIAFLAADDVEDAIRKAISLGGDTDTMACIAGGIAQAYFGEVSSYVISNTKMRLPIALLEVLEAFEARYSCYR